MFNSWFLKSQKFNYWLLGTSMNWFPILLFRVHGEGGQCQREMTLSQWGVIMHVDPNRGSCSSPASPAFMYTEEALLCKPNCISTNTVAILVFLLDQVTHAEILLAL